MENISIKPIGIISTPFKNRSEAPRQTVYSDGAKGKIKIFGEYIKGLKGIEKYKYLILIFYFHRSKGYNLLTVPPHSNEEKGVFATRSPNRPNPLGFSVVKLLKVGPNYLEVENVDMVDGTPIIDIKPYVNSLDKK